MRIIELIIDENDESSGIEAISLVEQPAIESNFVALNKHQLQLKEIDAKKQILMGPALIPDKSIYRRSESGDEYYIYFSKKTVRKASELFFKKSNHKNATFEHKDKINGVTIVESWIVENKDKDKTALYGLDVPVGTWMVSAKIDDKELYEKARSGDVKGFSIEGYFADKYNMSSDEKEDKIAYLKEILNVQLETYNDYPKKASENAKRAIRIKDETGIKCGTLVGWQRASSLAKGENISRETIARMSAFARHKKNSDGNPKEDCGALMWLAWGGTEGVEWAQRKLKQIDSEGK